MIEKEISLHDALTGVDFVITHLDGRKIRIKNKPGEVIKPDDIKTIDNHGMPFHNQGFKFGNLFVIFKITFPTHLNATQLQKIGEALTHMKKSKDTDMDVAETCHLKEYAESHRNTHHEGGNEGNESDEEGEEGGGQPGGVRC